MILNYKTGKLPFNFIVLGIMLLIAGIWRMIILDWIGILFIAISVLFLFIKSGLVIDTDTRRIKKYTGLFLIKIGDWEDIDSILNVQIIRVIKAQSMHVLSIRRMETKEGYKMMLVLPHKRIELMAGEKEYIINASKEISELLKTKVLSSNV